MILLLLAGLFVTRSDCQSSSQYTEWPSGSYGLPSPKTGCPSTAKSVWKTGWRLQDMEDSPSRTRSRVSAGSHMLVKFIGDKKDIKRTFCMKAKTGTPKRNWPKGSYCIYKKGSSCPEGMDDGWIYWDDEDYRNGNSHGGSLPFGSYDGNTKIYYCCQTKGQWYNSIELPVSQPFYLLTSSSTANPVCQMVKWAFSYLEYIVFDTNHQNNADNAGGKHAFRKYRQKIYYCYYEDCRRYLTDPKIPSDSFQSHSAPVTKFDKRSQYCSWLITILDTYIISLNFKEITIPSCDGTFLRVYDGKNDTAPLIGTYCGSNATIELKIKSSANNLFIVSNSGNPWNNNGFKFDAQYNAEHMTGCRDEIIGMADYIRSPEINAPEHYPRYSNCSWLVTVDEAYLVNLKSTSISIKDDDFIKVYDGSNENTPELIRYPNSNDTIKNGTLVSSSNVIYIVLTFGESSTHSTQFIFHYARQLKPTEKITKFELTRTSHISNVTTQTPDRDLAKQNEDNQTTYIIVAIVVSVIFILLLVGLFVFLRRRKKNAETSGELHMNRAYSLSYANPSPQERIWIGSSRKVCKESKNPIYEAAEGQEPVALYCSVDATNEPLVKNGAGAAQSNNPLYDVGGVTLVSHEYAEPNEQKKGIVYDEPRV
ncbi:cubilin-like isoform X2 [Dendronephthya gigantea]|uniref:cubilin-like isoform X2 n=1 Tax=Dendronephthya gigantea TaxID=151771 RepID=UPI00106A7627|nr:cubilin-like isoform X2 [Dendronephthya gigantea]